MALFSVIELLWWAHGNAKNGKNSLVLVLIGQSKEKWKNILSKEIHKWCQIVLHEFVLGIGIKSSFSPFFTLFLLLCALANVTFFFSFEASMLKVSWSTAMLKSLFTSMLRQWTSLFAWKQQQNIQVGIFIWSCMLPAYQRLSLTQRWNWSHATFVSQAFYPFQN